MSPDISSLPDLPAWVTPSRAETSGAVAFRSGAALTVLDMLIQDPDQAVPVRLLANNLALTAATATSRLEGRLTQQDVIRDAYHLTPPGAERGPDGDGLAFWRDATRMPLRGRTAQGKLADLLGAHLIPDRSETTGDTPLAQCVAMLRHVLQADDRAERAACCLSDIALARSLNWPQILPVSARHLTKALLRDLTRNQPNAALRIQQALLKSVEDTVPLARSLAQRAQALRQIAPRLRAKGSAAAVDVFLSEPAVSPATTLSPRILGTTQPMTDRAARRLCDRLVALGVVRELTGRSTFRLYGV